MFKKAFFAWMILLLAIFATACSPEKSAEKQAEPVNKTEIMISAAASLKDALTELKPKFESQHPNVILTYSFAGSGKLVQQIEQGAPVDVFLSASKKDMDTLSDKKLLAANTRTDFAKNELVLIVPEGGKVALDSFEKLASAPLAHIAVGEPKGVPAGRYTQEVFDKLGLSAKLQGKLVFGNDVRQVLSYVESGNAEAGIVYASDANVSKKVKVVATANPEWHKPIIYPAAVLARSSHAEEAKAFLAYLTGPEGKATLKSYGFQ